MAETTRHFEILPFRRPSDPTRAEIEQGVQPFDGWAVNVRCLEGVDLDSIPVRRIFGTTPGCSSCRVRRRS